ncbi:MAG TPA: PilN domain-containing protein [Longimicrobium sp.]|nr:PilN domain-containing protein [Longimicrobium sp.]
MIEINLLPSGTQRRPVAARRAGAGPSLSSLGADPRLAALGGVAVLFLLLAGYWFWTSGQKRGEVQAQIEREAQDSVRLERTIALMKALDVRRDTIDRKMDVIRQVDTRRYVWSHLMDEVSRATPPFMWLTRIAVVEDEEAAAPAPPTAAEKAKADSAKAKGGADSASAAAPAVPADAQGPVFNLEGNAGSTEALTRFMKNLEASPMIREVTLVTSQREEVLGRTVHKFTLEARWEEPDSAFVETVPLLTAR